MTSVSEYKKETLCQLPIGTLESYRNLHRNIASDIIDDINEGNKPIDYTYLLIDESSGYQGIVQHHYCKIFKDNGFDLYFKVPNANVHDPEPLVSFIRLINGADPGLLIVESIGILRLFPDLLGKGELFEKDCISLKFDFAQNESVEFLVVLPYHGIVVGSTSQLYFVSLYNFKLKREFLVYNLTHMIPKSMAQKMGGYLGFENENNHSVTTCCYTMQDNNGNETECWIHAAVNENLITWKLDLGFFGKPTLIHMHPISPISASELNLNSLSCNILKQEMVDMASVSGFLVFLVYLSDPNVKNWANYALATYKVNHDEFELISLKLLDCLEGVELSNGQVAKLLLPNNDENVVIQFNFGIVVTTILHSQVQYFIPFYTESQFQTIEVNDIMGQKSGIMASLDVGYMRFMFNNASEEKYIYQGYIGFGGLDYQFSKHPLKSLLEQAVILGEVKGNPVAYYTLLKERFQNGNQLNSIINDLLIDWMETEPASTTPISSLIKARFSLHLNFIHLLHNTQLSQWLTPLIKHKLLSVGQKLAAIQQLHHHIEIRNDTLENNRVNHLLKNAIKALYFGEHKGNELKYFFSKDINRLPELLNEIYRSINRRHNTEISRLNIDELSLLAHEANYVILITLKTMLDHTLKFCVSYHLPESGSAASPSPLDWESDAVELLFHLQELTISILERYWVSHERALKKDIYSLNFDISTSLQELSGHTSKRLFSMKHQLGAMIEMSLGLLDRLRRLHNGNDYESINLNDVEMIVDSEKTEKYLRNAFKALVDFGLGTACLELSCKHRRFQYLVEHLPKLFDPLYPALNQLVEEFGESLLKPLFQHFTRQNNTSKLLELAEHYPEFSRSYFLANHPQLKWFVDIKDGNYDEATKLLVESAQRQKAVTPKMMLYSLGKLAMFSQPEANPDTLSPEKKQQFEAINDQLDILLVHEQLCFLFNDHLNRCQIAPMKIYHKQDIEPIIPSLLSKLIRTKRPCMVEIFKYGICEILNGKTLDFELLIDMLTIKNNKIDCQDSGFMAFNGLDLAFDTFLRLDNQVSKEGADYALKTMWRRVYLYDNWEIIDKEEEEFGEEHFLNTVYGTALYLMMLMTIDHSKYSSLNKAWILPPSKSYFVDSDYFEMRMQKYSQLGFTTSMIRSEYEAESEMLRNYVENHRLDKFFKIVYHLVSKEISNS